MFVNFFRKDCEFFSPCFLSYLTTLDQKKICQTKRNYIHIVRHVLFTCVWIQDRTSIKIPSLILFNSVEEVIPHIRTDIITIHLSSIGLKDIFPLQNLTRLVKLDLHGNKIRDTRPFQNLTNLVELNLFNNDVSCMEGLIEVVIEGEMATC